MRRRGCERERQTSSLVHPAPTFQVSPGAWGRSPLKQPLGKEPVNDASNESLSAHPVSS